MTIKGKRTVVQLYRREKYLGRIRPFYQDEDIIKVITGVRRCGKSCIMQTVVEELEEGGISAADIVYIDLDSRANRKVTTPDQLERLIDSTASDATGATKHLMTMDHLLQERNGIHHVNLVDFMAEEKTF